MNIKELERQLTTKDIKVTEFDIARAKMRMGEWVQCAIDIPAPASRMQIEMRSEDVYTVRVLLWGENIPREFTFMQFFEEEKR